MPKLLDILLQRSDGNVPWGFDIFGGFDSDVAPFISSVTFGSLAAQHLNAGDRVLQIQRQPAGGMLRSELERAVRETGKNLRLLVEKTTCCRSRSLVLPPRKKYLADIEFDVTFSVKGAGRLSSSGSYQYRMKGKWGGPMVPMPEEDELRAAQDSEISLLGSREPVVQQFQKLGDKMDPEALS